MIWSERFNRVARCLRLSIRSEKDFQAGDLTLTEDVSEGGGIFCPIEPLRTDGLLTLVSSV